MADEYRIPVSPAFTDERGTITDLLNRVEIAHIGIITSKKGTIRGNHYHKRASQYIYVLTGTIELFRQGTVGEVQMTAYKRGELFLDPPQSAHAMRFPEDTEFLVLTTLPRDEGGYEEDTVRLETPLIS